MKYYIVAVLLAMLALASAQEFKLRNIEDLAKVRMECRVAKQIPAAHIQKFNQFEYPNDEITRCYIQCILEKFTLFNAKDGFQVNNLVTQLGHGKENKDAVRTDVQMCSDKNEQKSDSCSWAYRGFKCFISKDLPLVQENIKNN